jgi:hypothetical protein
MNTELQAYTMPRIGDMAPDFDAVTVSTPFNRQWLIVKTIGLINNENKLCDLILFTFS